MDLRKRLGSIFAAAVAVAVIAGVAVMAGRVNATARFVTWPVVGFTALAASTAIVGAWFARSRPGLLALGVLVSLPVSYVLPVAPMTVIAVVLVCLIGLSVRTGAGAAGVATGVGTLMVLLVVLQGPAVECGHASISSNSGPWWVGSSGSSSSGSGWASPDGAARGTTQVGDRTYEYTCDGDRLTSFQRVD